MTPMENAIRRARVNTSSRLSRGLLRENGRPNFPELRIALVGVFSLKMHNWIN